MATLPGSVCEYSNLSAALAGYLVELVTEDNLSNYSKQHLLASLGMHNTGWRVSVLDLNQPIYVC